MDDGKRENNLPSSGGYTGKTVEDHEETKTTPCLGIGNVHATVTEEGEGRGGDHGPAFTIVVVDGTNDEEADIHGGIADSGEQIDIGGAETEAGLEVGREGGKGEEGAREGHD